MIVCNDCATIFSKIDHQAQFNIEFHLIIIATVRGRGGNKML